MLKFEKLKTKDKHERYRNLVKVPTFFVLLLLVAYNVNPVITGLFFTTTLIIDLLFYGIVIKKRDYSPKELLVDSLVLYIISFLVILFIAPTLSDLLKTILDFELSANLLLKIELLCSILSIYVLWYGVVFIQNKIINRPAEWKISVLFISKKTDF